MRRELHLHLAAIPFLGLCLLAACAGPGSRLPAGWERLYPTFAAPVYQLLRDPDDPRRIYAACGWQSQSQTRQIGGVLYSVDRGERWLPASRGLAPGVDVLALAFAPPGFGGGDRPLVAGTDGAGLFLSTDDGSSWTRLGRGEEERLTVHALVALASEDGGPAVLAGTRSRGVLLSADGGATWEAHNDGLRNLTVKALAVDPEGGLVAGTLYGGVYRSAGPGRAWRPLKPEEDRLAVSALAFDDDGTLWVGLRSSGLLALPRGAAAFQAQNDDVLRNVGVLAIAAGPRRVAVGTSGQGAAFGRNGRRFAQVRDGLDNSTVTSLSPDPEDSEAIVAGTMAGLYRSRPPASRAGLLLAVVILAIGLTVTGAILWRRSDQVAVLQALGEFKKKVRKSQGEFYIFYDHLGMERPPGKRKAFLESFARRLERAPGRITRLLAESFRMHAQLIGIFDAAGGHLDGETRREYAEVWSDLVPIHDSLAHALEERGFAQEATHQFAVVAAGRLNAAMLRAENLSHLAALQGDLEELKRRLAAAPAIVETFGPNFSTARRLLDAFDQLSQLPGSDDRTLVLGQALTLVLQLQEEVEQRYRERPTLSAVNTTVIAESLRQILAAAIQGVQQRAELVMELRSRVLTARRETVVVLEVRNVGQGNAHKVEVELLADAGLFQAVRPRQGVKHLLRQQAARLEFLIEPRVTDRVRLRFRLTYSDLERQDQTLEFADVVELRVVAESTFVALYPNPYVVGRPLGQGDVFIGREKTIDRIATSLGGAHQDNVVILIGQRRMGKTSILRRLRTRLAGAYVPVLVDLQGLLGDGDVAFFRELVAVVQDELAEAGVDVPAPDDEELRLDPGGTFRRRFLRPVNQRLGEKRLLLMIDEFEVLEERISTGTLTAQILPYLRSLVQHEAGTSFLFSGTHRLDELTRDYWSVLFNLSVYLDVGHFSPAQVGKLFTAPTKEAFEIDPLALDKAFLLAGGHPHFSQLLAREMVEQRNRDRLTYVTVQDLNKVADVVIDKGQLHITYLWNEASHDERLLLLAVRELLDREGLASVAAVHRYLRQHRMEPDDLPAAAHRLERKEVLASQAGQLSFRMELLRRWLRRNQSLELFTLGDSRTESDERDEG